MVYRIMITSLILTILVACGSRGGGSSSGTANGSVVSSGLKIFVTESTHVGDFENDPTLTGSNWVEKADSFCNIDQSKPDNNNYKALLVDGVNRDAVNLVNWVLQPDTTYYRSYNNVVIDKTTQDAIFPAFYSDMTNAIHDGFGLGGTPGNPPPTSNVWTGIDDASDFSTTDNCNGWSVGDNSLYALKGIVYYKGGWAFSSPGGNACAFQYRLYCVQQP